MTGVESTAGRLMMGAALVAVGLLAVTACGGDSGPQPATERMEGDGGVSVTESALSEDARAGMEIFDTNCSVCHGAGAAGTDQGPPLIHKIYEPGHHSDVSIRSAVRVGVKQHHWFFGDMPPVAAVSPDDVEKIVCYIRQTQRANGIFEGDDFNTGC